MEPTHTLSMARRSPRRGLTACTAAVVGCLAGLLAASPASAQDFSVQVEGAGAFWVDAPQSDRFTPGLYLAVRPGVALTPYLNLQVSYSMLLAPAGEGYSATGAAHSLSGGLRLRPLAPLRPASEQLGGLWLDLNLGYVRTGNLDRFGLDAGLGYGFQVAPWFAVGPVIRYVHIVQPDEIRNRDPNDAQLFTAGLNLSFGRAHKDEVAEIEAVPAQECPEAPECVQESKVSEIPATVAGCPDGDKDGVCDSEDRCPATAGLVATLGCPVDPCSGKPLTVLVQFPYDKATLPARQPGNPQTMDPVLEAVAEAIDREPSCRVCIVGHASEEGAASYNLDLSRQRAEAVKGYMTARGLSASRLPTIGRGEACQIVPERSRPLNRRVVFIRLNEGESCPTDCSE